MADSDIQITEIMFNPSGVEPDFEFVELHNTGATSVNILNWTLNDATAGAGSLNNIANGGAIDVPAGGYVVLANGNVTKAEFEAVYGPVPVGVTFISIANGPWPGLNNTGGDTVTLANSTGTQVATVSYVAGDAAEGESAYVTGGVVTGSGAPTAGAVCFGFDTMIATPTGETAVQDLQIGDQINTDDGTVVEVKWIGRQTVMGGFRPAERLEPVKFAQGSLGKNIPHRDLTVTADHGMVINGVVYNASTLVNDQTICYVPWHSLPKSITYFHIETECHNVVFANGAKSETFVDYIGRQVFDNYGEYITLYGAEKPITEMPLPRVSSKRLVPANLRRQLVA